MALTYTVTKKSVNKVQEGLFHITHNLVCNDGAIEVINQDVSAEYRLGDNPSVITVEFQTKMQAIIDQYKAEQTIFTNALLNQQVTWLNSHLAG